MNYIFFVLFFVAGVIAALAFISLRKKKDISVAGDAKSTFPSAEIKTEALEEKVPGNKTEKIQRQLNNLFLVNELSQRITSSLSIEESFGHLYHTINSMMDASVVELVVYDGDVRLFFSNKKYSVSNSQLASYNHLGEWCFINKKEVFLEDAENDYGRYVFKPLTLPDGKAAQSLMTFPVYSQEEITGTLSIISFNKNGFELFHKEMIRLLLPFVGVAINNAFAHQQIIELKQRAERSEQFMQVFLANMSHEIRTPMNAVMGMTNILLQKNPLKEQLKYLNTIQKSSENLLVILNDILDLSKIEAGKIEIEKIDFSVYDVVNTVEEIIQIKAEEKGLILKTEVDKKILPVLIGDPTRLAQILINLAGNSVKFTEKGYVNISVRSQQPADSSEPTTNSILQTINFSVSDTGIGMSEEQQKKLFQNYSQASTETTRKYGGTGLGLSISKQLVHLQGGTIEISSAAGKGSTFSFSLSYPVSSNKIIASGEKAVSEAMLAKLDSIRILLADDNEYNRIVVRETLELKINNVKVDEAQDGLAAIQMLQRNDYDVVIMDLVMPNLNGLETTQKIRTEFSPPKNRIPIIAITASVLKSEMAKCFAAGMNGFIPKPFKTSEMIAAIYGALYNEVRVETTDTAVPKAAKSGSLIDLSYVNEMSEGDTERIKRYAELFISKSTGAMNDLKTALLNNEIEKIRIAAHSIKSMLKFNGIMAGFELAEAIEQNCENKTHLGQLPELIERLNAICGEAREEIRKSPQPR